MPTRINLLVRSYLLALFLVFFSFNVFAQKAVTGKVTGKANGLPIAGATVQVRGTTVVSLSNNDGVFTINVPGEKSVLIVSVVGYETIEQPVSGKNNFSFSLVETTSQLNEVLVTGYSAQRKKDITGSVSVVNVKDLKAVPAGSPEQMLQGMHPV